MAISRFSNPAEQPILDNYVPIPFAELSYSLRQKQGELDQAKEQEYQLRNLAASLKADPLTNQYLLPEVMNEYTPKLNELSERIAKGDDIGYKQEVGRIARQWQNDPRVKAIRNSREQFEKYQPDLQKAKKESKYAEFYDDYINKYAKSIEQYKSGQGDFPTFNYEGMKERQDYVEPADKLMKGISSDSHGWEGYKKENGELVINGLGQIQKSDGKWEKIDETKVLNVAKANTEAFLSTEGGRYFIDEAIAQGITDPRKIQDLATEHLFKIGYKQIFKKDSSGVNLQNLSDRALDKLESDQEEFSFSGALAPATALADQYKVNIPMLDDYSVKSTYGGFSPTVGSSVYGLNFKKTGDKPITFNKEQETILEKAQNKFKRVASDPKDKAKLINEYLEDWKKQGVNVNVKYYTIDDRGTPDVKKIEADNRAFFGEDQRGTSLGLNRTYKLMGGEGNKELNGSDFFKEYNSKDYTKRVVGELTPDNPYFVSGKQVEVVDKDGNIVATYAMNGARKESVQNEFKHKFYQAKYNPTGQTKIKLIPEGEDKPKEYIVDYESITDGPYDNLQNVGSRARLLDSKGNPVTDWVEDAEGRSSIDILYNNLAE